MHALVTVFLVLTMLGAGVPARAQGPVNPRTPSSGGGEGQATQRGSGDSGTPATRSTPEPRIAEAPAPRAEASDQRQAVPRTGPPPSSRRNQDRSVVVVPSARGGRSYYYRGRYYPYYPYGTTVGIYVGQPYWYPPHYRAVVQPYVRPTGRRYSELRLRVRPREAEVYVDGYYAGRVDNFDGVFQSLRLLPGPHHIEIVAPGYEVLEFDVGPAIGGKITYEGELIPAPLF